MRVLALLVVAACLGAQDELRMTIDVTNVRDPTQPAHIDHGHGNEGHPSNTRVFALSEDSRQMTENIVSHDANGVPHARANTWTRKCRRA